MSGNEVAGDGEIFVAGVVVPAKGCGVEVGARGRGGLKESGGEGMAAGIIGVVMFAAWFVGRRRGRARGTRVEEAADGVEYLDDVVGLAEEGVCARFVGFGGAVLEGEQDDGRVAVVGLSARVADEFEAGAVGEFVVEQEEVEVCAVLDEGEGHAGVGVVFDVPARHLKHVLDGLHERAVVFDVEDGGNGHGVESSVRKSGC